jgi:hypothetical protein
MFQPVRENDGTEKGESDICENNGTTFILAKLTALPSTPTDENNEDHTESRHHKYEITKNVEEKARETGLLERRTL